MENLKVTNKHLMHVLSKKKNMIFLVGINLIFIQLPYDQVINVQTVRICSKRNNRKVVLRRLGVLTNYN